MASATWGGSREFPAFILYPVAALLQCHTTRVGGRPNFVEQIQVLRLGENGNT